MIKVTAAHCCCPFLSLAMRPFPLISNIIQRIFWITNKFNSVLSLAVTVKVDIRDLLFLSRLSKSLGMRLSRPLGNTSSSSTKRTHWYSFIILHHDYHLSAVFGTVGQDSVNCLGAFSFHNRFALVPFCMASMPLTLVKHQGHIVAVPF